MPTPDGRIGARDLCAGAAVERVIADGGVTSLKISATLESDNYSAGSAGWQINRATGSAEFQDVVVRGTLNADDITTGTLSVDRIGANSIGFGKITLTAALEATQYIQSTTYTPGSAGWRINADGTAEFDDVTIRGTITAGAGSDVDWSYIQNVAIVNADITNLSADKINAGTLSASYIDTGTIGAYTISLANSASSKIQSNNGTDWYIRGDGVALFADVTVTGTINADSGYLGTLDVSGTLTMTSGGGFRTGTISTANRIEINQSALTYIGWYASGSSTPYGTIAGTTNTLTVAASTITLDAATLNLDGSSSWNLKDNGTTILSGNTSGIDAHGYAITNVDEIVADVGSASDPSYTFDGDTDTGIYRSGTNQLGFAAGSELVMIMTTDYLTNADASDRPAIRFDASSAVGTPAYSFYGDTDTGIYQVTGDYMAVAAGGLILQQWGKTGGGAKEIYLYGLPGKAQSSPDEYVIYDTVAGDLSYDTSTRDVKTNIRRLVSHTGQYQKLVPSIFDDIDGESTNIAGFIAEDVAETHPHLATWGYRTTVGPDEEPTEEELRIINWNMKGMIATTVAELQKLIERVEALEAS